MFDPVQVRALDGRLKDIQTCPEPILRCLGCVLRVVDLLEGEPSPQSEVLSALKQVFIKDLSVFCSVIFSLNLTGLPGLTCFTVGMVPVAFRPKSSLLVSSDQIIFILMV